MQKLFSIQDKKFISQIDKSEKDLQQFICDNWKALFPQYTFITQEFTLKGAVHPSGSSGRIDILAYNPDTKRFVFFELKKNYDKNIGHQAANYRHYIKKNFLDVYVDALQKYKVTLPDKKEVDDKEVEMILIAKEFTPLLIDQAEDENLITLIEYNWFENDLILLDYVHNAPDIIEPGDDDSTKEPPKKWIEKMVDMGWEHHVSHTKDASFRKAVADIPFTKENFDQLKALVAKVPHKGRRAILNTLLETLEQ